MKGLIFSKPPENYPIRSKPPKVFCKKGALKNLANFRGTPVLESLFNRVAGLKACNFIKKAPAQEVSWEIYRIRKNT